MKNEIINTALLVMDVQLGIVERIAHNDQYITKVERVVDYAHKNNITVIYVVVSFRSGFPEVSPNNKSFGAIKNAVPSYLMNAMPVITPLDNDVVVVKKRVSAFAGSDLEVVLRAKGIQHLVLTGIATSGVVLSTLREAADKDFKITVLSDLCADMDAEVHQVLMGKVFPRQADVMNFEDWMKV